MTNRSDTFVYTITQQMPFNAISAVFEDKVEDVLEVVSVEIDGKSEYVDETSGNFVRFITEDASADRNNKVTMTITAKFRKGITDSELIEKYGTTNVPNKATVTINGDPKATNEVLVTPPPVEPEDPIKKVDGKDKVTISNRDKEFTYTVTQKIPEGAVEVVFTDVLEDVLEASEAIISVDGAEISIEGQVVTAKIADARAYADKIITLTIKANIKAEATEEELDAYTNREVPNVATVIIDGKGKVTNKVLVEPPTPTPDEPEIEKLVETSKTKINNKHGDISQLEEVFTYTIRTTMPKNAKAFSITDRLDSVLDFFGDVKVTIDGKTAGAAVTKDGFLAVAFSEEEVKANGGKSVEIVFQANIVVSEEELVAKYADRTVPNVARYQITDLNGEEFAPVDSNKVTVTPPGPEPEPTIPPEKDKEDKPVKPETKTPDKPEPSKPTTPSQPGNTPTKSQPKTGDESNALLWIGLLVMAMAGTVGARKLRKNNK